MAAYTAPSVPAINSSAPAAVANRGFTGAAKIIKPTEWAVVDRAVRSNQEEYIGYKWGSDFELKPGGSGRTLKRINMRVGHGVDQLQLVYTDGTSDTASSTVGGGGGQSDFFQLDSDEGIMAVYIWTDRKKQRIQSLQFQTTTGRASGRYGGQWSNKVESFALFGQVSATIPGPLEKPMILSGFKGRAGNSIHAILPTWTEAGIETRLINKGQEFGGNGGSPFNDLAKIGNPLLMSLARVDLWKGYQKGWKRPQVGGIQCYFRNGQDPELIPGQLHGQAVNERKSFEFAVRENVVALEVRADWEIDALRFITRTTDGEMKHYDQFGGDGGNKYRTDAPIAYIEGKPDYSLGMALLGFAGRSGSRIDRLVPLWAPNPPTGYQVIIESIEAWDQPGTITATDTRVSSAVEGSVYNRTDDPMTARVTVEHQVVKSTTVQVEDSITNTSGMRRAVTVSVGSEVGGVSVGTEVTFEAFEEISGTHTRAEGFTKSETLIFSVEQEVTIPPHHYLQHEALYVKAECKDVKWTGRLVVTFSNGAEFSYKPVTGTFSGLDASQVQATYETFPIVDTPDKPDGNEG